MVSRIPGNHRITIGADKAYDTRGSAIDRRTTRHVGYSMSQRTRKRVEEIFGWLKTVGTLQKLKHRGRERVGWIFTLATATYNLVRMRNIELQGAG